MRRLCSPTPVFLLILVLGAASLVSCKSSEADEAAVSFRRPAIGGGELSPADFRGQVVLVDFWATWCGPCHAQAEILEKVWKDVEGDGVQFLAVDLGEDRKTVEDFLAESPYPYPVLLDEEDSLMVELGIIALPAVMVVDREGRVTYFESGVVPERQVRELLEEAGA